MFKKKVKLPEKYRAKNYEGKRLHKVVRVPPPQKRVVDYSSDLSKENYESM